MTYVYDARQVQRGEVPILGAHRPASAELLDGWKELATRHPDLIVAGIRYGSAAEPITDDSTSTDDGPGVEGDVDFFGRYSRLPDHTEQSEIDALLDKIARQWRVVIDFHYITDDEVMASGGECIDDLFLVEALRRTAENKANVFGVDRLFAGLTTFENLATVEAAHKAQLFLVHYLHRKLEQFTEASHETESDDYRHQFQRALEFASVAGRKAVRFAQLTGKGAAHMEPDAGRTIAEQRFLELDVPDEIRQHAKALIDLREVYSLMLMFTIARKSPLTLMVYNDWVHGTRREAAEHAWHVARYFLSIVVAV